MKTKWLIRLFFLLIPMLACMEPCEHRTAVCSRAVVELVGYCPGLRQVQDDGFLCTQSGQSFSGREYSCERCP